MIHPKNIVGLAPGDAPSRVDTSSPAWNTMPCPSCQDTGLTLSLVRDADYRHTTTRYRICHRCTAWYTQTMHCPLCAGSTFHPDGGFGPDNFCTRCLGAGVVAKSA